MAQPRTPPELIDDVIEHILVRIQPDESAYLARASLVCKLWRRIVSDPGFTRRYRELHRTPPLLGFLHDTESGRLFFPTAPTCPFPQSAFDCRRWWALDDYRRLRAHDCRHGRVLFRHSGARHLLVWDPISGDQEELPMPDIRIMFYSAMVLCAVAGCHHGDCVGGPFLVVFVGTSGAWARGCVYSSQARAWGTTVSLYLGKSQVLLDVKRAVLIGDDAYFLVCDPAKILRYNLDENRLSTFDPPDWYNWTVAVMPTDDGSLGLAGIRDSNLCLWLREVNLKGVARWVQYRVMELDKLLPNLPHKRANVIGFAEGVGILFVRIRKNTFMIELKSGWVRKVSEHAEFYNVLPFMSFYNSDSASSVLLLPAVKK